jgi:hypothetical protein
VEPLAVVETGCCVVAALHFAEVVDDSHKVVPLERLVFDRVLRAVGN